MIHRGDFSFSRDSSFYGLFGKQAQQKRYAKKIKIRGSG
jgi:hypothetical protein